MQSNCVVPSNWMVIAVPVILGLFAVLLLFMVIARLSNKRLVDRYEFIRKHPASAAYLFFDLVIKESKLQHK